MDMKMLQLASKGCTPLFPQIALRHLLSLSMLKPDIFSFNAESIVNMMMKSHLRLITHLDGLNLTIPA